MFQVVQELPLEDISVLQLEPASAVHHALADFTLVDSLIIEDDSVPFLDSFHKASNVLLPFRSQHPPFSIELPLLECTDVQAFAGKDLLPFPFLEIVDEVPLEPVPIAGCVHPVAMFLVANKLPRIDITVVVLELPLSVEAAVHKQSIVLRSCSPILHNFQRAFSAFLTIDKVSLVSGSVVEPHLTKSVSQILHKPPLVLVPGGKCFEAIPFLQPFLDGAVVPGSVFEPNVSMYDDTIPKETFLLHLVALEGPMPMVLEVPETPSVCVAILVGDV